MQKNDMQQLIMGWTAFLVGAFCFSLVPRPHFLVNNFGLDSYVAFIVYALVTLVMFYGAAKCSHGYGRPISAGLGGLFLYQAAITILGPQAAWYSVGGTIILGFFLANNIVYWLLYLRKNR